jgi:hypothetical protein
MSSLTVPKCVRSTSSVAGRSCFRITTSTDPILCVVELVEGMLQLAVASLDPHCCFHIPQEQVLPRCNVITGGNIDECVERESECVCVCAWV